MPECPGTAALPVVVLISGRGSNLQALIDCQADWPYRIVAVLSDRPQAAGLAIARNAGIPTEVLEARGFADRTAYDAALAERIDRHRPGLVALAGFMRILTPALTERWAGRMLNIHPSLLPRHPGLHTHRRALECGDAEHGATVHFVTAELDGGPPVAQVRVPVLPDDNPDKLAERVLRREHRLYPMVVGWFAAGRLKLDGDERAVLDGTPLAGPVRLGDAELGIG